MLICDNGQQYRSKEFQKLASDYLITRSHVTIKYTPYYLFEQIRVNRTLKIMMAMYVTDKQRKWDVKLQRIACAFRTAHTV